jgi:glycosyltransferase involved in cell wall biosynthesis
VNVVVLTTDNREPQKQYQAASPSFGTAPEALLQGFAEFPETEFHVVSCTRRPMESPEKLAPNIFFHSLVVPKFGWMRSFFQGCIRAVRKKLQEIQPDIVHGQGTEGDCAISAVFSGFPNVITIHGNMRLVAQVNRAKAFSYPWLAARIESFTVPRSDGVVCITRYTQSAVEHLAKQTWLLPNAVDRSFFDIDAVPAANTPPRILFPAHVCFRKNQNAFIRALDPLAARISFELIFLGAVSPGQAYDEEFLALVRARPWCSHAGFADRAKLRSYLSEASAVVLASMEDNCPMVVLEAMAAGVPVVAARVGGVPDLIESEVTGLFCDPHEAESMRDAVSKCLAHPQAAQARAKAAKLSAWKRFHPHVVAKHHLDIYRQVLTQRQGAP